MATYTTNLELIKPAGTDKIRIAQINQNMDTIDNAIGAVGNTSLQAQVTAAANSLNAVESGVAILSNNNAHAAIASGQYVYITNHATLAEGMYVATQSIGANGELTLSNVTPVSGGAINALQSTTNQALSHYYDTNGVLKTLNGIDVRTVTEAGRYYCVGCTNLPGGTGYGYLDVYVYNANYRRLLFHEASYASMYTTRLQNGTWQSWQELAIVGSERSENLTSKASVTSGSAIINNVYLNRNGPVGVLTINVKAPNSPIPIGQSSIISIQDLKIHGFVTGCGFSGNTVMVATGSTSNNVASINVRPIAAQLEANYSSAIAIPCILSE